MYLVKVYICLKRQVLQEDGLNVCLLVIYISSIHQLSVLEYLLEFLRTAPLLTDDCEG